MRNNRVSVLVECALAVALAAVLNFVAVRLPINIAGGSISLTMLPIALVAIRRGPAAGAVAGLLFGTLDFFVQPYIVHWAQVILDYPLPYLLFGCGVGLFSRLYAKVAYAKATEGIAQGSTTNALSNALTRGSVLIVVSFVVGGLLRYAAHVLSGVIFFAEYAGGDNVWIYSLVYNITYLAPSLVVSFVLSLIIVPILARAVPISKPYRFPQKPLDHN